MKMKKSHKTKGLSIVLTAAMVISSMTAPATGSAAKKVSMSGHTEVQVGKKVILRLKNNKKRVKWSVTAGKKKYPALCQKEKERCHQGNKKRLCKGAGKDRQEEIYL